MKKSEQAYKLYGNPAGDSVKDHLKLFTIPSEITEKIPVFPKRIYCNRALFPKLIEALNLIILRGLENEIKSFDGCYNVRKVRGYNDIWSLHSWGIAIDINAKTNGLGVIGDMSKELVLCFETAGFDWGGNFTRKDGMHFELSKL